MIKLIIGLGNPGSKFYYTRHNIGFRVIDALIEKLGGEWCSRDNMELAEINIDGKNLFLVKPQTYMNSSGEVIPYFLKKCIKSEEILVVHDDIELSFGKVEFKFGGSARGHNGLKSIISFLGKDFGRVRCGISRPVLKEDVPDYVLSKFPEKFDLVEKFINDAQDLILEKLAAETIQE